MPPVSRCMERRGASGSWRDLRARGQSAGSKWIRLSTREITPSYVSMPILCADVQACKVQAILSDEELPGDDAEWVTISDKKPLGSHRQHWLDRERAVSPTAVFSHVKLITFPGKLASRLSLTKDGGLKRLRVYGHPLKPTPVIPAPTTITLSTLPLTPETFAPYGQVIQGFSLPTSAPKGKHVTVANQGTAAKFHRMGAINETYQPGALVRGGYYIAATRAESKLDISKGATVTVTTLER